MGSSSSGKGSTYSGGKGNMGLVESVLNPVGYVVPSMRKFDPVSSNIAPTIDKVLGTESQRAVNAKDPAWQQYYAANNMNKYGEAKEKPAWAQQKEQRGTHTAGTLAQARRPAVNNTSLLGTDEDLN